MSIFNILKSYFPKIKSSERNSLKDLSTLNHTYWKFTQSKPGRSYETNVFAEYKVNEITRAKDPDKGLSFTTEEYITKCFMYGDQLTKLCFSQDNPKFLEIQNNTYKSIGSALGELETDSLLVEKIYSLKHKETIRLLVSMIPDNEKISQLTWFTNIGGSTFKKRLEGYGFMESANLLKKIKQMETKQEVLDFLDSSPDF